MDKFRSSHSTVIDMFATINNDLFPYHAGQGAGATECYNTLDEYLK